ncbi:hypothetical protein AB5I41_10670 [Sphingomonas sp. MMS24-JH45]
MSDFQEMDEEFSLVRDLTRIAGQPLSFSMVQADVVPNQWRELTGRLEQAVAKGYPIKAQIAGRPVGLMLGCKARSTPSSVDRATPRSSTCRWRRRWRRCAIRCCARG